jgi:hypothetical protein
MLAITFTGPEAISAWVELVQKQQDTIQKKAGDILYSHENQASKLAAQRDISRVELANWDASVRARVQSADQAKVL